MTSGAGMVDQSVLRWEWVIGTETHEMRCPYLRNSNKSRRSRKDEDYFIFPRLATAYHKNYHFYRSTGWSNHRPMGSAKFHLGLAPALKGFRHH